MWIAAQPQSYVGKVVGDGHCVAYVRAAAGAPHTSAWRRGELVRGSGAPTGVVIATFNADGRYANATDGSSHAAILAAEQPAGLLVWDQWSGRAVAQRVIRFKQGGGMACDDGDRFYIVRAAEAAA